MERLNSKTALDLLLKDVIHDSKELTEDKNNGLDIVYMWGLVLAELLIK